MDKVIETIVARHWDLFGDGALPHRINVGFTNVIYTINGKYIVKICAKESKEAGFLKEIEFYKANKGNPYIPSFYFADTGKEAVPYFYEIIEKVDGVSLYNVWHTFSENHREDIIRQLCDILKEIHSAPATGYDWVEYNKNLFLPLFEKAQQMRLFTADEEKLLETVYSMFSKYLVSDKFTLVHNDLHFDNLIYKDGKIKLIDFERAVVAPVDFELDILYRMVRKPWKFASGETEDLTKAEDYESIMTYMGRYYPHLFDTPYIRQRLWLYDMIYFLNQYVNAPQYEDLKDDVITAAKAVLAPS